MKRALFAIWLVLPVAAYAYHMGPGQDLMRLDQAAALIESADLHVAEAQRIAADEGDALRPDEAVERDGVARGLDGHRSVALAGELVEGDAAVGLALGHRRLAILDLSPEGAQPMISAFGFRTRPLARPVCVARTPRIGR